MRLVVVSILAAFALYHFPYGAPNGGADLATIIVWGGVIGLVAKI